jgi:hypothetical protein
MLIYLLAFCHLINFHLTNFHPLYFTRLLLISDISCDIFGSIEFLDRATTIDNPCYQYDPIVGRESSMGGADRGITMMGVDILPTELPVESSTHFGNGVSDMLDELVRTKEGVTVAAARLSPRLVRSDSTSCVENAF